MITIEASNSAQTQFAARFNPDDWTELCRSQKFLDAVEALEFGLAEVIAWEILLKDLNANAEVSAKIHANQERLHESVRAFVSVWAAKTSRTGKGSKQSRQGHIRKLMKHGINSEYAQKMLDEAKQAA